MNNEENKDLIMGEQEVEPSEEVLTETPEETFEQVNGYYPQLTPEYNIYEPTFPTEEKKSVIDTSLKIACGILAGFVAVFAIFMLFFNPTQEKALRNSELNGTWIYRNGDVVSYYIFDDEGRLSLKSGMVTTVSGYGINLEEDNTFYLYAYGSPDTDNASEMKFDAYKEDGIDTLGIYVEGFESDKIVLQRSELPENELKPSKDFKANEKIVGKWENTENDLFIEIREDGYLQLDFSAIIYDATYVVDGNRVDFTFTTSYTNDTSETQSFYYEMDGDNFVFYLSEPSLGDGYVFTRVAE